MMNYQTVLELVEGYNSSATAKVDVFEGVPAGQYPYACPLRFVYWEKHGDWALLGNYEVYGKHKVFRPETPEEVQIILKEIPAKASEIYVRETAPILDPFYSTNPAHEARFVHSTKTKWDEYRDRKRIELSDQVRVAIRFYTTSYTGGVYVRGVPAEAFTKISHEKQGITPETWGEIGSFSWGQNGSGFLRKYEEAIGLLQRLCAGDWTDVEALTQENRSGSYSPRGTGSNVRIWSATLTDPELAKQHIAFPLTLPEVFR